MVRLVTEDVRGRNKVLEIAAGTGLVTIEVVKVVSELTATDLSPDMLSILSTRLAENNHANVQTEIADVMSLQYSDQTFDAVIAANILHLLPDLPGALRQIRRVLKPDGILCVPTFAHGQSPWTQVVSRAMAVVGFPVVARFDGESFQKVLQENGFEVINERIVPGLLPIVHVTAKPMEGWKE
ncbi:hypothetical protein HK097_010145 [Rhizophlyctis rosea]|uniref:Methyltransferase domain-containing protein n=1 Tax=Rhizophlyctis rosea TaxID=64517 RepID=A0AAD5SB76_9FUNG|nr:hypothetical protein HK097_010145 [Rhizophlyctis rosea]